MSGTTISNAAAAIADADAILLIAGTGATVDSGIPTGIDLCKGNIYEDLCMLRGSDFNGAVCRDNPELFYGFWGRYYNMAVEGKLHKGLAAVREWGKRVPEVEEGVNGFFVYSQGIDGVAAGMVPGNDACQVHGSLRYWQCIDQCTEKVFTLPETYRFAINPVSLTCKPSPSGQTYSPPPLLPHYTNIPTDESAQVGTHPAINPITSHPQCPVCAGPAVPNLIELGVEVCNDQAFSALNYITWRMSAEQLSAGKKAVILEVGCSEKTPTGREEGEELANELSASLIDTTFIRVNPYEAGVGGMKEGGCLRVISIEDTAEHALAAIDEKVKAVK